jgi:hypothetical protein
MLPRHETPTRPVDERHDCQDIGPAYVPGTVWGTASSQTAKFRSRRRACLLIPANYYATRLGSQPAPDQQDNNIDSGKASFSTASPARLTPLRPPGANAGKTDPAGIPRRIKSGPQQILIATCGVLSPCSCGAHGAAYE